MISRLVHYAADAVLVSTFLAGVKRTTGYTPNTQTLPLLSDPTMSSLFTRYLSVGEKIFDTGASYASHSSYFKQVDPAIAVRSGLEKSAKAGWDRLMQGEHHDDQNNNKEKDSSGKSWWGK